MRNIGTFIPLYLSLWYTPKELATRGSIIYSTACLAGAFNGLIAYGITKEYAYHPPFQPWQWLFLVEGLISIAFGFLSFVLIPPAPEKLRWGFSPGEKRLAVVRTKWANNTPGAKLQWHQVLSTFRTPLFLVFTYVQIASHPPVKSPSLVDLVSSQRSSRAWVIRRFKLS